MAENSISKNYLITWKTGNQDILQITYTTNISLSNILNAHQEAESFVRSVQHNVVVFNDSQQNTFDNIRIGDIKERIFNNIPKVPKNLKGIVILVHKQAAALSVAIETLGNIQYGSKFIQVVDSYIKAEKIINTKLGK